jgi:nucleotide-binding universal stress UspA family protein
MKKVDTILVTTDFSETAKAAFGPAKLLARKFGARLVLAHVEPDILPLLVVEYSAVGMEDLLERNRARAAEQLAEVAAELGDGVATAQTTGSAHEGIVRLAAEHGADLIVIATHGRGFISHAILGSTTERVLRRAPCPVLVVRPQAGG